MKGILTSLSSLASNAVGSAHTSSEFSFPRIIQIHSNIEEISGNYEFESKFEHADLEEYRDPSDPMNIKRKIGKGMETSANSTALIGKPIRFCWIKTKKTDQSDEKENSYRVCYKLLYSPLRVSKIMAKSVNKVSVHAPSDLIKQWKLVEEKTFEKSLTVEYRELFFSVEGNDTDYERFFMPGKFTSSERSSDFASCSFEKSGEMIHRIKVFDLTPANWKFIFAHHGETSEIVKAKIEQEFDYRTFEQVLYEVSFSMNKQPFSRVNSQVCSNGLMVEKMSKSDLERIRAHNSKMKRTVAIIGAGPVGLFMAALLKNLLPENEAYVFEKRNEYKRTHALKIDENLLENVSDLQLDKKFHEMIKSWIPRTRTNILETDLKEYCEKIGIKILTNAKIESVEDLIAHEIRPDLIIAADGAKSAWRKTVTADSEEFSVNKTIGHMLQVKCEACGEIERIKGFKTFTQNLEAEENFFDIRVGNYDSTTDSTPITCFCFINEEISAEFKNVPSFEGLDLEGVSKLGPENEDLQAFVVDASNVLKSVCKNGIIEQSMRISALPVIYYVSSSVVGTVSSKNSDESIPCFLIGDAAMGLSLEKGLNYGWKASIQLSQYLSYSPSLAAAQEGFKIRFKDISSKSIAAVRNDYFKYKKQVQNASLLRSYFGDSIKASLTISESIKQKKVQRKSDRLTNENNNRAIAEKKERVNIKNEL
jgi:hypothetical protein